MIAQDTIDNVRTQINETNPADSHFTDAQLLKYINECTVDILSRISAYPKADFTVNIASDITLDESLAVVDFIYHLSDGKYKQLNTIDFDTFAVNNPSWLNEPAGEPTTAIRMDATSWKIWPTPSSEYASDTLKVYGRTIPEAIVSATETLPFTQTVHRAYEHFVAYKCWPMLNDVQKANIEYNTYEMIVRQQTSVITATVGSKKYFKWG